MEPKKLVVITHKDSPLAQMLREMEKEERRMTEGWVEYLVCYLDRDAEVEPKDEAYTPKNVFVEIARPPSLYAAQRVAEMAKKQGLLPVILTLRHSDYEFLYKEYVVIRGPYHRFYPKRRSSLCDYPPEYREIVEGGFIDYNSASDRARQLNSELEEPTTDESEPAQENLKGGE